VMEQEGIGSLIVCVVRKRRCQSPSKRERGLLRTGRDAAPMELPLLVNVTV